MVKKSLSSSKGLSHCGDMADCPYLAAIFHSSSLLFIWTAVFPAPRHNSQSKGRVCGELRDGLKALLWPLRLRTSFWVSGEGFPFWGTGKGQKENITCVKPFFILLWYYSLSGKDAWTNEENHHWCLTRWKTWLLSPFSRATGWHGYHLPLGFLWHELLKILCLNRLSLWYK